MCVGIPTHVKYNGSFGLVPPKNPNEYPYIAEAFKSMYRGQIDRNASPEKIEQFYEEAMTRLRLMIPQCWAKI